MCQVGKPINAVAREIKLHRTSVTAIHDRHDVPVRAHYMTNAHIDQARALHATGASFAEIARHLGFDLTTISNCFTGRGIQKRGQLSTRESS